MKKAGLPSACNRRARSCISRVLASAGHSKDDHSHFGDELVPASATTASKHALQVGVVREVFPQRNIAQGSSEVDECRLGAGN